ncbi:MAG TPA: ribosomal protein S18-alanine N-acetyltransferase [Nocardioides sp.]|uniref:ribosomal protein S18-alanine N-acetyltransferase n=1 Tax=Nocardioides sp. TaxID=35761 RepID=UPI002F40A063
MIRPAERGDGPAIAALEKQAFGSDAWSDDLLAEGLSGEIPGTLYLVAVEAGVLGYAAASLFADVAELQRIAVAVTHRRTGIASALLERVEEEARLRYSERLLLEVREGNAGALAFYARRGFTEVNRRPRYYADGTTAIVLERRLTDDVSDGGS